MLEALLMAYQQAFGERFPLAKCEGMMEIDVINTIYYCVQEGVPFEEGMHYDERVVGSPGDKKHKA